MRKRLWATLLVGAASALAVGLTAAPVAAAGKTWTVAPGGSFVTSTPGTSSILTDASTFAHFTCDGLTAQGVLKVGAALTNPLAHITVLNDAKSGTPQITCTGDGLIFTLTFNRFPMGIKAVQYNATAGKVTGEIDNIDATIAAATGAPGCAAIVDGTASGAGDGSARFEYLNSSGLVQSFGGGSHPLHAYTVTGCNSVIRTGDVLTYKGSFTIKSSPGGVVNTITSP
jgi:hypothetical protein